MRTRRKLRRISERGAGAPCSDAAFGCGAASMQTTAGEVQTECPSAAVLLWRFFMRRALVFLLLVVLFPLTFSLTLHSRAAAPQSSSTPDSAANDSQTLQALLREVRELRQDLRAATVASERAQILLTRLQAQQQAVTTAQKELDDAHTQLLRAETRRNNIENQIKYYSDQDNEDSTPDATKRQSLEQNIQRLKGVLQEVDSQRDSAQASETQAKQQLQLEQSKLDALQSELDQIDRALANLASRPVN